MGFENQRVVGVSYNTYNTKHELRTRINFNPSMDEKLYPLYNWGGGITVKPRAPDV